MENSLIILAAFAILIGLILLRVPIFISLGIAGIVGLYLARGVVGVTQAPFSVMGQLNNFTLAAAPLYVIIGETLYVTGIGRDLYEAAQKWFSWVPGGLAVASVMAAAVFGAMCGVSIAGVAVIGVMAVPEMLRHRYDPALASGSITASGALAMLIPPSVLFILYAAVSGVSVGRLFIAGIVPGVFLAVLMICYIVIRVRLNPALAPRHKKRVGWAERFYSLRRLWTALLLIVLILGSIYSGICTPTESGAVGALAALLIAAFVYRALSWENFKHILLNTARVTGAIVVIAASAFIFSQFLLYTRVPDIITGSLVGLGWPPIWAFFLVMLLLVFLGMFIDGASITLVTTPILLPAVSTLGFDPLWYGVIMVMNMEMAVITPPVGLNLYAMKSVAPDMRLEDIIRGALPYVLIEFGALIPFIFFPDLILWLPRLMKG